MLCSAGLHTALRCALSQILSDPSDAERNQFRSLLIKSLCLNDISTDGPQMKGKPERVTRPAERLWDGAGERSPSCRDDLPDLHHKPDFLWKCTYFLSLLSFQSNLCLAVVPVKIILQKCNLYICICSFKHMLKNTILLNLKVTRHIDNWNINDVNYDIQSQLQ